MLGLADAPSLQPQTLEDIISKVFPSLENLYAEIGAIAYEWTIVIRDTCYILQYHPKARQCDRWSVSYDTHPEKMRNGRVVHHLAHRKKRFASVVDAYTFIVE